jgi:hypothetical protein
MSENCSLPKFYSDPDFFKKIVTGDETWCFAYDRSHVIFTFHSWLLKFITLMFAMQISPLNTETT